MKKRLLLPYCLVIILSCQSILAQDLPRYALPSPDVAALMRYTEIPVSHSTGVPNIEVDLYKATSGKLQLPIKLTYHASGNKVQDIASVVGLGWVLQAGGAISCQALGIPDISQNYFNYYKSSTDIQNKITQDINSGNGALSKDRLDRMYYNNDYETMSDRYMYNFNGYSGVFRYDLSTLTQHKIPYRPIEIKSVTGVAAPSGEIIIEDGTKYFFEHVENGVIGTGNYTRLLTKIVSADLTDQIQLFYKSTTDALSQFRPLFRLTMGDNYTFEISNPESPAPDLDRAPHFTTTLSNSSYYETSNPSVLDYILTKEAKIVFEYATDRVDGAKTRLIFVKIYDRYSNEKVREVSLDQSYFGTQSANNRRLRLDAVNISGKAGSVTEKTSFSYNTTTLPPYYTLTTPRFKEDYWGYYNGSDSPTLIPSEFLPDSYTQSIYGGDLNPHPEYAQAAILQEITYPTGGKTIFEFESNRGGAYVYTSNDITGGLRIKKIKTIADPTAAALIKSYEYLTVGAAPYIYSDFFHYEQYNEYYFFHNYFSLLHPRVKQDVYTNNSYATLKPGNSISVYYSLVRENIGDEIQGINSYITYEYDIPPFNYYPDQLGGHPRFLAENHFDHGTFEPKLLNQSESRKINNNFLTVKNTNHTYTTFRASEFLTGFKIDRLDLHILRGNTSADWIPVINYLNGFFTSDTKGYEDISLLTKTEVSDYSDIDHPVKRTTNYNYIDNENLQMVSKEVSTSTGDKLISSYKYPHDFDGTQPYTDMVHSKHMWNQLVEQNDYRNNTSDFLQSTRTNYADWGTGIIAPHTIETKHQGELTYETRIQFYGYDANGNVLSLAKDKDPKISYLWGYNGEYPIAEAKNASSEEIFYECFEVNGTTGAAHTGSKYHAGDFAITWLKPNARNYKVSYWYLQNSSWHYIIANYTGAVTLSLGDGIDDVRIYPVDAQITTYTYAPLIGITSITDAKGQVSYFDYDDFQRLLNIRDQNMNIVKRMSYHYKPF